jgi:hypothetical protein
VITIAPTNPQVVYVPTYNPTVVYGAWPYPAYPPYYPYPPGYVFGTAALSFGLGMAAGAMWGNCNWNNGNVDVDINNHNSYSKNVNRTEVANERTSQYERGQGGERGQRRGGAAGNRAEWKHNPENRKGVQYRDQATQQRYTREEPQATGPARPSAGGPSKAARISRGAVAARTAALRAAGARRRALVRASQGPVGVRDPSAAEGVRRARSRAWVPAATSGAPATEGSPVARAA